MSKNESSSKLKVLVAWCNNARCSEPLYQNTAFVVILNTDGETDYYCKGHEPKQVVEDEEDEKA